MALQPANDTLGCIGSRHSFFVLSAAHMSIAHMSSRRQLGRVRYSGDKHITNALALAMPRFISSMNASVHPISALSNHTVYSSRSCSPVLMRWQHSPVLPRLHHGIDATGSESEQAVVVAGNHKSVEVLAAGQHVSDAGKLGGKHIRKRPHRHRATGLRPFDAHVVLRTVHGKFDFSRLTLLQSGHQAGDDADMG